MYIAYDNFSFSPLPEERNFLYDKTLVACFMVCFTLLNAYVTVKSLKEV
jgi:hypothetical protein